MNPCIKECNHIKAVGWGGGGGTGQALGHAYSQVWGSLFMDIIIIMTITMDCSLENKCYKVVLVIPWRRQ